MNSPVQAMRQLCWVKQLQQYVCGSHGSEDDVPCMHSGWAERVDTASIHVRSVVINYSVGMQLKVCLP